MCGPSDSAKADQKASAKMAEDQFQWQKDQAKQAAADAAAKRQAMAEGLKKIGNRFGKFDDKYFDGISDDYRDYANPQVAKSQASSEFGLRSALANRGKLGSSTDARQSADLVGTYGGIYRDTELKAQEYATQQRGIVNNAKQSAINQMYASESQDAGLQAASGAVQSLNQGASFEPVTALLAQASKFATLDYNNSIYNGKSNGVFSPLFGSQTAAANANPATSGSDTKVYNGS